MKTLRIITLLTLIAFVSKAQIPNASFETWNPQGAGEVPAFWMTSDSLSRALGGGASVYKDVDPFDGTYSMHLKSVNTAVNIKGPGVATNGVISFTGSAFAFNGGSPNSIRAKFLTGYFKYNPTVANDSAMVTVVMLRNNAGNRDTIAVGMDRFGGQTAAYTPFTTTLNYRDWVNNPDTCLIIIQSSLAINDPNLGVASEFVIDSLNFAGTVGIEEASDVINSVTLYPTPAQTKLNIHVDLKKKVNMSANIYDLNGKQVLTLQSIDEKQSIDISGLSKGNYILKLTDENGKSLASRNFMKE
jgi:hypothetical protein